MPPLVDTWHRAREKVMALTGVLRSRLRAVRVPQGEHAVLATLLCGGLDLTGLHLSLASWSSSGGGVVTHVPEGVALWVLGILLTVLALWKPSPPATRPQPARRQLIPWALILFVAIALRIFAIGDAPAAISGDEGSVGLVGWEFVSGQRNNLFQTAWHSLPPLFFGLVSLSQRLFGRTLEAIRLFSVLGGTLSIVATYWAAGKLFGRRSALLSAAFLAVSPLHLLFSRIATASVWG